MKNFEYKNHLHEIEHVGSRLVLGDEKRLSSPLVTVIMPIYNHPVFFRKSLSAVLNQKCDFEYEVIIVDNGHPELQKENQKVVEELMTPFTWYYVNNENVGGCNNQNMGILLANGKYITFCHDDDMLTEKALQVLIDWAKQLNNDTCAIFGNLEYIDENDNKLKRYDEWKSFFLKRKKCYPISMYDFLQRNYTNGCGSLYNRESLLEMGGFNSDYIPCPDYALNVKYTSLFGAYAIRDITLNYRISSQSDSSTAYKHLVEANNKVRLHIIKSKSVNAFIARTVVVSSSQCEVYHLNALWSKRLKGFSYYYYRVFNRMLMYFFQFHRMIR